MMDLDLTGRRAVVTGASIGIGAATVEMLADHGASVAFCARNPDAVELLSAYRPASEEGSVHGYVADMSDGDSVQSFLNAVDRDMTNAANYRAVENRLDIDDFISYMLVNVGLGNSDWGPKNYYVSYNPQLPDGKWRYHSWDAEKVFQALNDDVSTRNDAGGPTGLQRQLMQNDDYRIRFADHVYNQCYNGGVMSVEGLQRAYKRRTEEIERAIVLESARWGDAARGVSTPYTKADWDEHRDWIMETYFPARVGIATTQFRNADLLGDLDLPTFQEHGGHVDSGYALKINKSVFAQGKPYYTLDGSDPRLPGGKLSETALEYTAPVTLTESATVKARLYKGSIFGAIEWSALLEADFVVGASPATKSTVAITKIHYHPAGASEGEKAAGYSRKDFEFIGFTNMSDQPASLLGASLSDGVRFDFNSIANSQIPAKATAFLVKNRAAFEMRYGTTLTVLGEYAGSLSNDGEGLVLTSGETTLADLVYNDAGNWPIGTDGEGAYLVLDTPTTFPDSSAGQSWRASTKEDVPLAIAGETPVPADLDYATWSATAFAAGAPNTSAADDADGDRFNNYLEFLMGSDPTSANSLPHFAVVPSSDDLPIFEISRRMGAQETFTFETTRDFVSWKNVTENELSDIGTTPGKHAGQEIRRFRILQLTRDLPWTERFVRISVPFPKL